ncbi:MAG: hypothetical protein GY717_15225 [Rhodobacteraceae bacterium]|nr:hypothetical protein [Paracoccaceae bacterium]
MSNERWAEKSALHKARSHGSQRSLATGAATATCGRTIISMIGSGVASLFMLFAPLEGWRHVYPQIS